MMVVLLSDDLMGMSRVEGVARQAGISFRLLPNVEAVAELCAMQPWHSCWWIWRRRRLDVVALVRRLRSGIGRTRAADHRLRATRA